MKQPGKAFPERSRRAQRGAVAVYVAVALIAILTSVMLVIEIGRLYFAQADLQKLATLAAVSAARTVSGCSTGGVPGSLTDVELSVQNALTANSVEDRAAALATMTGINGSPAVEIGRVVSSAGLRVFQPLDVNDPSLRPRIDSVRVNLTRPAPTPILPFISASAAVLKASATAREPAVASFRLGTSAASVNAEGLNTLLTALLGTRVDLSVADFQNGLAAARLTLAGLMLAAGVGDLNELLALETDLPGALAIVGAALKASGDAASGSAGGLIAGLAGQTYTGATPTANFFGQIFGNLGESLNPTASDTLATVPFVDALGLLTALGEAARKDSTVAIPVSGSVPGITSLGVFLTVLDNAKIAGPGPAGFDDSDPPQAYTFAQSSQIVVKVRANLTVNVGGLLTVADARLALDLQGANGRSELTAVTCPTAANPLATADISTAVSLLAAKVGTFTGDAAANPPANPAAGNVATVAGLVNVAAEVGSNRFDKTETQTGSGPDFPVMLPPISADENVGNVVRSLLAANLQVNPLGALPLPAGDVLAALLVPIAGLLDGLLDPLLATLGISAGEATVTLDSITTAQPAIVTTCVPALSGTRGCPPLP